MIKLNRCLAISFYESLSTILDWFLMLISYSHARCLQTYPLGVVPYDLNEEITKGLQEYVELLYRTRPSGTSSSNGTPQDHSRYLECYV